MKLLVKIIDSPSVPGERALALCNENGEMLPMQTGCTVVCDVGEMSKITVSFWVDGDDIRFVD